MAKNTGKGHRIGAVKGRSEFKVNGAHPKAEWVRKPPVSSRQRAM